MDWSKLAEQYAVHVTFDEQCGKDRACSCGGGIMMGKFSDLDKEIMSFFHELGHIVGQRDYPRTHKLSIISDEGMA